MDVRNNSGTSNLPQENFFIKISFRLKIGELIDSSIMQLLAVPFAKELVHTLMGSVSEDAIQQITSAQPAPQAAQPAYSSPTPPPAQPVQPVPSVHQAPPMAAAVPSYAAPIPSYPQTLGGGVNRNINVNPVQFANFQGGGITQGEETNLNLLLDIPLRVTVELGRTQKQIKDILELSQGSIIELDKLAGEPVDILVNNKLIAKGEVVVIDENFGVRVTDIVSQWDRVQKIQ
jgi:flagellar motor switch protein FliN